MGCSVECINSSHCFLWQGVLSDCWQLSMSFECNAGPHRVREQLVCISERLAFHFVAHVNRLAKLIYFILCASSRDLGSRLFSPLHVWFSAEMDLKIISG